MDSHKNDGGKLRFDVVPEQWGIALALIMNFGARKYGAGTWKQVPNAKNRYYSALRRHLAAFRLGEELDRESKMPHLWHVAVNALMMQSIIEDETEEKGEPDFDKFKKCVKEDNKKCECECERLHNPKEVRRVIILKLRGRRNGRR